MNVKKEVIDQMRAISRSKDLRATSCMIENWANALEQDEQQNFLSRENMNESNELRCSAATDAAACDCGVQPVALLKSILDEVERQQIALEAIKRRDLAERQAWFDGFKEGYMSAWKVVYDRFSEEKRKESR